MSYWRHLIFRGDHHCYAMQGNSFPYLDHAARAGASGVHLWFWCDTYRAARREFLVACRNLGLTVHLGIGIGAYGVTSPRDPNVPVWLAPPGGDPTDATSQQQIKDHVKRTLDEQDLAGLEFQTGEYDDIQYHAPTARSKSRARQLVDELNPIVDFALACRPGLWIRTELNASHFTLEDARKISRELDRRCTVEWSLWTGPFKGPDAFDKGRRLLAIDERFSWFLKLEYNGLRFWERLAPDLSPQHAAAWVEHWRGWVRLLHEMDRRTLTICHVAESGLNEASKLPHLAVAIAKNPDMPTDQALAMLQPPPAKQ